jgi:membrane fusion protein, heavy metal efflux system
MNTRNYNWVWVLITAIIAGASGYLLASRQPVPITSSKAEETETRQPIETEIKLPESYFASSNIVVETVSVGEIAAEITTSGKVEAAPGGEASVVARVAGVITRINKRPGDPVLTGEVIATVDSFEASAMTAERNTAKAKLELARKVYERETALFEQGVTPRQDMEAAQSALSVAEADAARANVVAQVAKISADGHSIQVVSPFKGHITSESVVVGAFVQPNVEIFRVVSKQQLQIEAFVTASEVSRVKIGDAATVTTRNGKKINARVYSITPSVNGSNQAATAILTTDEPAPPYVLGEGVQITLHSHPDKDTGLIVPEEAIQRLDGQDIVFIRTADGFRPQSIVVGMRSGGEAQLLSGVKQGDAIATRNAFLLKAELVKNAITEEE